ncbi:unnamed protein product, partial [Musa hybrid cultivar]
GYRPPAVPRYRRRIRGARHGVGREGGRDFEEEGNRGVPSVHARILKPIESLIEHINFNASNNYSLWSLNHNGVQLGHVHQVLFSLPKYDKHIRFFTQPLYKYII